MRKLVLTTYMEMTERPDLSEGDSPLKNISIERVDLTVEGYRKIYRAVGGPYRWYDRLLMDEEELEEVLAQSEVFILRLGGRFAGYFEIDRKDPSDVEITYLGILKEYHGRGLGRYLLTRCLRAAWDEDTERVWLHTCEWDHPGAVPLYENSGFKVFKRELHDQKVPPDLPEPIK